MINILIGLFGLGIVIFVHELGHLLAAKAVGISVEAFSIGWGRALWSRSFRGTEYRISWLPIGGYCKMKGEHALIRAWQDRADHVNVEEGDFLAARPWQRIFVLVAGPLANVLSAIVVFGLVALVGTTTQDFPARIVLVGDYSDAITPAEEAGLETGDVVRTIDGATIRSFGDLREIVSRSADRDIVMTIERAGSERTVTVTPALDRSSGAGTIGVYPWVEPIVDEVGEGSAAELAGIATGDRIVAVDGQATPHSIAVEMALRAATRAEVAIAVERDGASVPVTAVPQADEAGVPRLGVAFQAMTVETPGLGPVRALATGARDTIDTLTLSLRGLGMLFRGIDVTNALLGPVRITYLVGEVATVGFAAGLMRGLTTLASFLGLLSVTLAFMNLLPIPVLDGGQIVLTVVEAIARRPLHPRLVYRYQMVGNVLILALMVFALFNDLIFFARG